MEIWDWLKNAMCVRLVERRSRIEIGAGRDIRGLNSLNSSLARTRSERRRRFPRRFSDRVHETGLPTYIYIVVSARKFGRWSKCGFAAMSRRTRRICRASLSPKNRPYGQWIWNASNFFIIGSFSLSRKVRTRSNLVLSSSVLQSEFHARSNQPKLKVSRHELMEKSWVCKEILNESRKINTSYFVPKVARDNLCWL